MPDGGTGDRLIDDSGNQVDISNVAGKFSDNEGLIFYPLDSSGAKQQNVQKLYKGLTYFAWNDGIASTLGVGAEHELMLADPLDACSSLSADYSNKVAIFDLGGSCSLSDKANNVKATGAVAGILLDGNPPLNTDPGVTGLPFVTVFANPDFQGTFYDIALGLSNGFRYTLVTRGNSPHDYTATFSSYGSSSQDSYILPKLTAPGIMLSAGTDGNYDATQSSCTPQVSQKMGTSMACPAAAGAAALVRQYFMDGFYPTGSKVSENAVEPTASLLTAVLVAGASAMQGVAIRDGSPLQLYDEYQGFGRVDLSRSLPIDGVTDPNWKMKVWQRQLFEREGQRKLFTVHASGSAPLVFILAWMDLPASSTGEPALINDLDLKVIAPDGSLFWGNNRTNGDRSNNIEKVVLDSPGAGHYSVEVTAVAIDTLEGPQSFSVVVLGGIQDSETTEVSTEPPPPPSPSVSPLPPSPPPPGSGSCANPIPVDPSPSATLLLDPCNFDHDALSEHFDDVVMLLGPFNTSTEIRIEATGGEVGLHVHTMCPHVAYSDGWVVSSLAHLPWELSSLEFAAQPSVVYYIVLEPANSLACGKSNVTFTSGVYLPPPLPPPPLSPSPPISTAAGSCLDPVLVDPSPYASLVLNPCGREDSSASQGSDAVMLLGPFNTYLAIKVEGVGESALYVDTSCPGGDQVARDLNNAPSERSKVEFLAEPSMPYFVVLEPANDFACGDIDVVVMSTNISLPLPPEPGSCVNPIIVDHPSPSTSLLLDPCTYEDDVDPRHFDDVVMRLGPFNTTTGIRIEATGGEVGLEVYTECPPGGYVASDLAHLPWELSSVEFAAQPSVPYYVVLQPATSISCGTSNVTFMSGI